MGVKDMGSFDTVVECEGEDGPSDGFLCRLESAGIWKTRNSMVLATPLLVAAAGGHTGALEELLKTGTKAGGEEGTLALRAAQSDEAKSLLRAHGAGLVDECAAGNIEAACKLLATGADPNAGVAGQRTDNYWEIVKYTPLSAALEGGHMDIVAELLEAGATPAQPAAVLMKAVRSGHTGVAFWLANSGTNADDEVGIEEKHSADHTPSQVMRTPLYVAVADGNVAMVEALLAPRQAAWLVQSAATKAEAFAARKAFAPAAVRGVLEGSSHNDMGNEGMRDVTTWLVSAHAAAYADPAAKRLARLVLGVEKFARSMERLGVWGMYREGLRRYLCALGEPLGEIFVRDNLCTVLGNLTLPPHALVAADQAKCTAEGQPHVLRSDIDGIVPLPAAWDFGDPVERQQHERVFMHLVKMMAIALNENFHQMMRDLLAPFVVMGEGVMEKKEDGGWRLTPEKGIARMEW